MWGNTILEEQAPMSICSYSEAQNMQRWKRWKQDICPGSSRTSEASACALHLCILMKCERQQCFAQGTAAEWSLKDREFSVPYAKPDLASENRLLQP